MAAQTREIAKRWARDARVRERGLAVDDATLERVADVIMAPGYEDAGLYHTDEEWDAQLPGGFLKDGGAYDAIEEYLEARPEIAAGFGRGWRDGREVLFVGIVGDLDAHRAALEALGGDLVVLEQRLRTTAELDALAERIEADARALAAAGFELEPEPGPSARPQEGAVEVTVLGGRDERSVADFFATRYGSAVKVQWLGPTRLREVPQPFGSWTSDGRQLRVFFGIGVNGEQRGNARVAEETDERIVIELTRLEPVGLVTLRLARRR